MRDIRLPSVHMGGFLRRLASGRKSRAACAMLCVLVFAAANAVLAQDDVYLPEHPWLVVRSSSAAVAIASAMTLTAQCQADELLLGGGYRSSAPALDAFRYLSFEGNYPSGRRSWAVIVYNAPGATAASVVTAEAYCLTKPIAEVTIVESPASAARSDGQGLFFTSSHVARCPAGAVLASGGFRTTRSVNHAGMYNAWISRSMPFGGTGWRVDVEAIQWTPPPTPPTTRAYALCLSLAPERLGQGAGQGMRLAQLGVPQMPRAPGISAGAFVSYEVPPDSPFGFTRYVGQAQCPQGEVAVGGGYEFIGDRLIPHHVHRTSVAAVLLALSSAPELRRPVSLPRTRLTLRDDVTVPANPFGGWGIGGVHGFERGQSGGLNAHVPCLKFPEVHLTVRIIHPAAGANPALEFRGGEFTGFTAPMAFRAIAGDGFGNYVGDADLAWSVNGQPIGSGEILTASLPASRCSIEQATVQVVAMRGGHTATAEARILLGGIC